MSGSCGCRITLTQKENKQNSSGRGIPTKQDIQWEPIKSVRFDDLPFSIQHAIRKNNLCWYQDPTENNMENAIKCLSCSEQVKNCRCYVSSVSGHSPTSTVILPEGTNTREDTPDAYLQRLRDDYWIKYSCRHMVGDTDDRSLIYFHQNMCSCSVCDERIKNCACNFEVHAGLEDEDPVTQTAIKQQVPEKAYNGLKKSCKYFTGKDDEESVQQFYDRLTSGQDPFSKQMGLEDASTELTKGESDQQNVRFRDHMPMYKYTVDSVMDPTRSLQDTNDATLDNFFSRPIKIASLEWVTGAPIVDEILPWELYFNNPRVINRLANYKLLKAKLHLKVVINGNGFHFGRCMVIYQPLHNFDTLSRFSTSNIADMVQASQFPHIFLDPTTSTGGEMSLPFMWHENYLDVPTSNWSEMGKLYVRTLNELKHANGATDNATISIFAWATDVSTSVLTSRDPIALVPQMGKENEVDEANAKGTISKTASAVAKISRNLSVVPSIAPFALATANVASATASLARLLGYSRPAVTKNPEPFRNHPISHLAATNVPDTSYKLTVDDKQELSIDPRIAGLGANDPMSIRGIASRESYLTSFRWTQGSLPEHFLFNCRVDPVLWAESGVSHTAYHLPACSMAALPFQYWTGTMKFRFQIVCSAFHKGRLKIVYDPDFLSSNEYNTNYLEIVDIADTQDFTIEIGNGQTRTLLDHSTPGQDPIGYDTAQFTDKREGNGVIGVFVVNELTTPNSTVDNSVEINVFVSMGEDFEVFVPSSQIGNYVFDHQLQAQMGLEFSPQSGAEIVPESMGTTEPSAPDQTQSDILGPTSQDLSNVNMVYTGEAISSFRQLLKRYNLHRRELLENGNAFVHYTGRRLSFPLYRGAVPGAVDLDGNLARYNYCNTTLLHWITTAHQGWRGSIRYKMLMNQTVKNVTSDPTLDASVYVQRRPFQTTAWANTRQVLQSFANTSAACASAVQRPSTQLYSPLTGTRGMLYVNDKVNPSAEFEVPYLAPVRFTPGKTANYTSHTMLCDGFEFEIKASSTAYSHVDFHVAAGEDFQVYLFTGLPRIYYEEAPPDAP